MKLRVKMILVMMMVLGTTMTVNGFSDVKDSDWFFESIENMKESHIISGYPDGTFKPQNTVTYGEFIKLITVATTGKDIGNSTTGHWSESYYNKAIEMGLFTETDISKERLDEGISREVMALLISNNFKDIEVDHYDLIQDSIRDLDQSHYPDDIIRAYGLGIIEGYAGEFRPNGTLTRAESTTVINRILNEDQRVVKNFNEIKKMDEYVNEYLQQNKIGEEMTSAQYYGSQSAEELREKYPIVYYAVSRSVRNKNSGLKLSDLSNLITNLDYMDTDFAFECKYYEIVDMNEIGVTDIIKELNDFNSERIAVYPGNDNTLAILIKGDKIVCNLDRGRSSDEEPMVYFPGSIRYYDGAYENTKLMDFDYIGFWTGGCDTLFLVGNPWIGRR